MAQTIYSFADPIYASRTNRDDVWAVTGWEHDDRRPNQSPEHLRDLLAKVFDWPDMIVLHAQFVGDIDPGICACALCGPFPEVETGIHGLSRADLLWWLRCTTCGRAVRLVDLGPGWEESLARRFAAVELGSETCDDADIAAIVATRSAIKRTARKAPSTTRDRDLRRLYRVLDLLLCEQELIQWLSDELTASQVDEVMDQYRDRLRKQLKQVCRALSVPATCLPDMTIFETRIRPPSRRLADLLELPNLLQQCPMRKREAD